MAMWSIFYIEQGKLEYELNMTQQQCETELKKLHAINHDTLLCVKHDTALTEKDVVVSLEDWV